MKSLISINDLDEGSLHRIFQRAETIKKQGFQQSLPQRIIATLFFEPSTRTKMSFETAIIRSGASVLGFAPENSSLKKGETLEDTVRIVSTYADLIVIRHPEEHAAQRAQLVSTCPIINAGDGTNEHPTQSLLDLFTILEHRKSLDDFTITLAGDLKYSRTIYSLIYALKKFTNARFILASPEALSLNPSFKQIIQDRIIKETYSLSEALDCDYFYMTRVQKERFPDPKDAFYEDHWILNKNLCQQYAKVDTKILHPLPRVNEINPDVDHTPYQLYFTQAQNGLYTRIALLEFLLGVSDEYL
ncbi:MAG: aspartate carbamoyltransferase [Brevinema sp.]